MIRPHASRLPALGVALILLLLALPGGAQELTKIRVIEVPVDLYMQAYYAEELGLFRKAGLNVEISSVMTAAPNAASIASGAADIAVTAATTVANGVSQGIPFTVVAASGLYSTNAASTALCVAKTSALRTAKDLEGKTIGVSGLNDQSTSAIKEWLDRGGADVTSVHFVEVPFPIMATALAQGRIDAAEIPEPGLSAALGGSARLLAKPFDLIAPEFLIGVWFSTTDWVKKNPDAARRFAAAIYEAARWANAHHAESAAILAKYSKVDVAVINGMTRALNAERLTPQLLQPPIDTAFKYHQIGRAVRADELIAKLP